MHDVAVWAVDRNSSGACSPDAAHGVRSPHGAGSMKRVFRFALAGVLATCAVGFALYQRDMHRHRARLQGRSAIIASPQGDIEYQQGGAGPAVLVIHGSGGGFDQGELIVRTVLDDSFHWVAPSRFGYLRSTFKPGATFDDQAHAYAALLDRLGIDRVAVVALSHGGPSALLFAVLYPARVSSLTLISCGVASSSAAEQTQANEKGGALITLFRHDFLYWGISRLFRRQFMGLMGATDQVVARLTPEQATRIGEVIDFMNPVEPRSAGATFDNQAAMPNERIAAIRTPTLIFHAKDDTLQLFHNAQYAADHIPGSTLRAFERGGHVLMAVEREVIQTTLAQHIRTHALR